MNEGGLSPTEFTPLPTARNPAEVEGANNWNQEIRGWTQEVVGKIPASDSLHPASKIGGRERNVCPMNALKPYAHHQESDKSAEPGGSMKPYAHHQESDKSAEPGGSLKSHAHREENDKSTEPDGPVAVSYTHLTLPTILRV